MFPILLGMLLSTRAPWAHQTDISSDLNQQIARVMLQRIDQLEVRRKEAALAKAKAAALHADRVGGTFSLGPEVKTEIPAYSAGDQFTLEGG
jgi:hypothetical protein